MYAASKSSLGDDDLWMVEMPRRVTNARVGLSDTHERLAWCDLLECSEDQLYAAVREAGPMLVDVKRKLGKTL